MEKLKRCPDCKENQEKHKCVRVTSLKKRVEWLKYYLKQRKKGCDSIKIKALLIVIDKAFPDLKEDTNWEKKKYVSMT